MLKIWSFLTQHLFNSKKNRSISLSPFHNLKRREKQSIRLKSSQSKSRAVLAAAEGSQSVKLVLHGPLQCSVAWRGTAGVLLAMCLLSLVSGQRKTIQNTSGRTLTTGGAFCQLASTAHECVEGKSSQSKCGGSLSTCYYTRYNPTAAAGRGEAVRGLWAGVARVAI